MDLVKCPDCGKEISRSAFSCPHCGHWFGIFHGTFLDGQKLSKKNKREWPADGDSKSFWDQFKSFGRHNFKKEE
jgi:predicted ATP-dependent serine protease